MGFSRHQCDWVAAILSSASTRVLLNNTPRERICHARGASLGRSNVVNVVPSGYGNYKCFDSESRVLVAVSAPQQQDLHVTWMI
jgi:hypothetical protein